MAEKTKKIVLTQADLRRLQQEFKPKMVCGHCGKVKFREYEDSKVCEDCVRAALESEGFPYRKETVRVQAVHSDLS